MFNGLHNKNLSNIFKITRKDKKDIKSSDYREWNDTEKKKYYKTFNTDWTTYQMNCFKYLYVKYAIIYNDEIQKKSNIKEKEKVIKLKSILHEGFESNKSHEETCDLFFNFFSSL
jgi:hypothetical protein